MRTAVGLTIALLLLPGCGGAFQETRRDRFIAVFHGQHGPRLVLVSESAFNGRTDPRYREGSNLEFSFSEVHAALATFIRGGRCPISGALIPPMDPDEAVKIRDEMAEMLPTNEGRSKNIRKVYDLWPELEGLAVLAEDSERTGASPRGLTASPGI